MREFLRQLGTQAPIYVTRETAGGLTGSYYLALGWTLLVMVIVLANILLWGAVGIAAAVGALL